MSTAPLTPAVPKPAHVPDALVYDFDLLLDPGLLADPHERLLQVLAEAPPIFWSPRGGGHWYLNRHAFSFEAARDWEAFSNQRVPEEVLKALMSKMPEHERIPVPVPIMLDPPSHAKYRKPLNAAFSPRSVMALEQEIRDLADRLISEVAPRGHCEFMAAVAEPLPVQVFLKFMGLPLDHQADYRELVRKQLSTPAGDTAASVEILREIAACMRDIIAARRDDPKDDLISRLWSADIDGAPVTQEDMENFGVLLFTAGLDTVMNAMGFGVRHLAMDQALQARLRSDPSLIVDAAEELLRRYTFLFGTRRVAKDVLFHGVEMKKDERLVLGLPTANLDGARFPEPEVVDIAREDKAHIVFNGGPHRCVGSHLARIEIQILYERMLALLPPFGLDPDQAATFHGGPVIGPDRLGLVWDAA